MSEKHEAQDQAKLKTLCAAAALGLADLNAGRCETLEVKDIEAFLAALRELSDKA